MPDDLRRIVEQVASESDAYREARRSFEICNACRYCEGYCSVFPAMGLRREFDKGDLTHLANLCHGCKGCYYACQYAPPHPYAINLPKVLAEVRAESYAEHAWPQPLARLFEHNGTIVALVTAVVTALLMLGVKLFSSPEVLYGVHTGEGAFYRVISHEMMVLLGGVTFGFGILAMLVGAVRYWRATGAARAGRITPMPVAKAAHDAFTLKNLDGGGHGCNDRDGDFTQVKRRLHHALFYGFLLCFAATNVGTLYHYGFGWQAPYGYLALPSLLGTSGGILMCIGAGGLMWLKTVQDPEPVARRLMGGEYALLILLFLVAFSGLVLTAFRGTSAMGMLLAFHIGLVLALFVLLPYSKFVHGIYRSLALLRNAMETRRARG